MQHLIERENNVLVRLIDDYLFITTDESDAKNFLEVMKRGHPEYGCFISQEKTLINFGYGDANISELNVGGILHPEKKCMLFIVGFSKSYLFLTCVHSSLSMVWIPH